MTEDLKFIILSPDINLIFLKHCWTYFDNTNENHDFKYKGEIADYYLKLDYYDKNFYFEYTLEFELSGNKIYSLLKIINTINNQSQTGFFYYDFVKNKIKFKKVENSFENLHKDKLAQIFDTNLYLSNILFKKFSLAIHSLIYGKTIDNNLLELLFLNAKGNA